MGSIERREPKDCSKHNPRWLKPASATIRFDPLLPVRDFFACLSSAAKTWRNSDTRTKVRASFGSAKHSRRRSFAVEGGTVCPDVAIIQECCLE